MQNKIYDLLQRTYFNFNDFYYDYLEFRLIGLFFTILIAFILFKLRIKIVKLIIGRTHFSVTKKFTLERVFIKTLGFAIVSLAIIEILIQLGFDSNTIFAVLGTLGVALGLAAKDLVRDFLMGAILIFEDSIHIGDIVSVNEYTGTVQDINIRTIILNSYDNKIHIVPNGTISTLTNHTRDKSSAVITVGVAYEENIDKVIEVLNDELQKAHTNYEEITSAPVVQGITEFADSSVNLRIVIECKVGTHWGLEREIRRLIKNRFDKENIEIPFNQTVVTMKKEQ